MERIRRVERILSDERPAHQMVKISTRDFKQRCHWARLLCPHPSIVLTPEDDPSPANHSDFDGGKAVQITAAIGWTGGQDLESRFA